METDRATRTWFGTLTLRPELQHRAKLEAAVYVKRRGIGDFEAMSEKEQFSARHRIVSQWLTKYIKRVRKSSGAPLRYLLVAEAHQSGLPHYHMLVHESSPEHPVTERVLRLKWTLGFSRWSLANEKSAAYVCKYLTKTAMARVRASRGYGSSSELREIAPDGTPNGSQVLSKRQAKRETPDPQKVDPAALL